MTDTVTFQTILDTKRETEKSYKIYTGAFLAKSLVTVVPTGGISERRVTQRNGRVTVIKCPIVMVTMPKWLSEKL
jgi:hypothetical protein